MAESESQESLQKPTSQPPPAPPSTTLDGHLADSSFSSILQRRPKIRVTSEYDSDSSVFFHKISCKLLDNLAKLKFTFQNDGKREIFEPRLAFVSKYLSLHYDIEEGNTLVNSAIDVRPGLQFKASHDVKAQQGKVAMVADLLGPAVKLELASAVPHDGMPKATLKFPFGEVSLEEKDLAEEEEEAKSNRIASLSGILRAPVLNGICFAQYSDENMSLRYSYKDEQMTFTPTLSLPSNSLAFAFKRQFSPSDKLSYWYNFNSNDWSTVYKHTVGKDFKMKAGYDSEVRLGWASLWVGDEDGKAKTAPMKMKVQFMLQVPQDDVKSSALMFRVKKRWDI